MQIDFIGIGLKIRANLIAVAAMVIVQMVVFPIVLFLFYLAFDIDSSIGYYVLLVAGAGSVFGTPAFAGLLGLDRTQALLGVIATTLLLPLTMLLILPLVIMTENQAGSAFDFSIYVSRIGLFIILPLGLSAIYQMLKKFVGRGRQDEILNIAVLIALVIFAISVMDGVAQKWVESPGLVAELFAWVMIIHTLFYFVSYFCFRHLGVQTAVAAGMLSAYRNLGLVVAISGPFLTNDFLIFVGLWQIPMYLSPLCLSLIHRKKQSITKSR